MLDIWIINLLAVVADNALTAEWRAHRAEWTRHEKVVFHSRLQARKHEQETEPQTK